MKTRRAYAPTLALLLLAGTASAGERPEPVLQAGHARELTGVGFSPDGRFVVSTGMDGRAILWEVPSGRLLRAYDAGLGGCYAAALSPDGKTLVTGHHDKRIAAWDTATGTLRFKGDTKGLFDALVVGGLRADALAFEPGGGSFWAGSEAGRQVRLDTATGKRLAERTVRPPPAGPASVAYESVRSADGTLRAWRGPDPADAKRSVLTVEDADGKVLFREARESGTASKPLGLLTGPPRLFVHQSAREPWSLDLIDLRTKAATRIGRLGPGQTPDRAAIGPGGEHAVTFTTGSLRLWSLREKALLAVAGSDRYPDPFDLEYDGATNALLVVRGSSLTRWDLAAGRPGRVWTVPKDAFVPMYDRLRAVVHSPRHRRTLAAGVNGVFLLDADLNPVGRIDTPSTRTGLFPTPGARETPHTLALSGDESLVAVGYGDSGGLFGASSGSVGVMLCELPSGRVVADLSVKGAKLASHSAALSADGSTAALEVVQTAGDTPVHEIRVWDVARRGGRGTIPVAGPVRLALSPDGRRLVASDRVEATVYDAVSLGVLHKVRVHENTSEGMFDRMFQYDLPVTRVGRAASVLSGGPDGTVRALNPETAFAGVPLSRHKAPVCDIGPFGKGLTSSAAEDGTVHLFDPNAAGPPVATLLLDANGTDWLVVTPEGLFDGSVGGRERVSFRVGGGLTVVPVDRFFQDFYRPGLLAAVHRGERPTPEAEIADARTPPTVRFASPKENTLVSDESAEVTVEAEDAGGGVSGLSLYHNGTRLLAAVGTTRAGKVTRRTFRVRLVEGQNRLEARAASGDGGWEAEPAKLVITYDKPPVKPDLYVLAVGVNEYADDKIRLKFAAADARGFGEVFDRRGKALYAAVHATTLLDAKATRAGIRAALADIAKRAQPRDTLVLTVSGHGTTLGQRYFFLPHEFRSDAAETLEQAVKKQGIPIDELGDWLTAVPALRKVLVLDTCGSGGATGLLQKGRNPFAFRGAIERMNRAQGMFTIAACAAGEEAQEVPELGHGVLSYALLSGLRAVDAGPLLESGVQANGPDQVADVLEWFTFAAGRAPALTKRYFGREQDIHTATQGTSFPLLPARD